MHERCLYPRCTCIKLGTRCLVAEAAEKERYCSYCGMPESEIWKGYDCGSIEVCANGGAEMVAPIERAIARAALGKGDSDDQ